ncbi:MAG: MotA/TolQ/ExbB proton channel family protein [Vulcanibacillus sp.]
MRKLDIMTPIGLIAGLVLIYLAIIITGSYAGAKIFISVSSMITVFGGLTAALLVNFNSEEFGLAFKSVKEAFYKDKQDISEIVELFIRLSTIARREGLLALDDRLDELEDPFIRKGIQLTVDGLESEQIRGILSAEIRAFEERKNVGISVLEKAGELAPAWGMIGTLIGLILMLLNLNDASKIGPTLALALITTFYGSVLANLFFIPLAGKVKSRTDFEIYVKQIMIEGILGVQSGQNPKVLEDRLNVYIVKDKKKGKSRLSESISNNEEVVFNDF